MHRLQCRGSFYAGLSAGHGGHAQGRRRDGEPGLRTQPRRHGEAQTDRDHPEFSAPGRLPFANGLINAVCVRQQSNRFCAASEMQQSQQEVCPGTHVKARGSLGTNNS